MVKFRQKGDFSKVTGYLERFKKGLHISKLDEYGKLGVRALSSATPVNTGVTADSWYYEIIHTKDSVTLSFKNKNVQDGVPIAVILQYGHATNNGGWVEGIDYVNPTIRPIFYDIAKSAWEEVTKV